MFELLVSKGAYTNMRDINNQNRNILLVIKINDNQSRKLYLKNKTILHFAAIEKIKWIEKIIQSGRLDVNARTNQTQYSLEKGGKMPLHYAASHNSIEVLEILILKGADINAKDIYFIIIIRIFLNNNTLN